MIIGMIICLVFGSLVSISNNYIILIIFKVISSVGVGFLISNSSTHLSETFLNK